MATYRQVVNLCEPREPFLPAREKLIQSSIGVQTFTRFIRFTRCERATRRTTNAKPFRVGTCKAA